MARHNLDTVIAFEVTRTLTKRRFWIATLLVPIVMGLVIALIVTSNTATASKVESQASARFSFTYTDASGYIEPAVAAALGGKEAPDDSAAIDDVRSGSIDAHFVFPSDPASEVTKVYGVDVGVFENGKYAAVAGHLLSTSAQIKLGDPSLAAVVRGSFGVDSTTFKEGRESSGMAEIVPPLVFLAIFYVVMMLLGNQMVTSLLEEKENRVSEMILTTVEPTTMVVGKTLSLSVIGLVQMLAFAVPVVIGYLFFRTELSLPYLDLSRLVVDPGPMIVGALLLIGGFTLFTTTLVMTGAMMPTARDAAQISAPLMVLIFAPLWAVSIVVSDPQAFIVKVLTFFPYTAPVTSLLRNGLGSLSTMEAVIVIAELFGLSAVVFRVAVRLFRYGSIEYSNKLGLKAVFSRQE